MNNQILYFSSYIPIDRRLAMACYQTLPDRTTGTALFADISGFTPLTKTMVDVFGPRKGAEELTRQLNEVYEALITCVHQFGGSVIGFSGDAITCWFDLDNGQRAVACGLVMQDSMRRFHKIELAATEAISLNLKVGLAVGPVRRFRVGDPQIQYFDVLAGSTVELMTAAEKQAHSGEVVIVNPLTPLVDMIDVTAWRCKDRVGDKTTSGDCFGVIQSLKHPPSAMPWPALPRQFTEPEVRPWVLPPVFDRLRGGQDDLFLAEIRPTVALFMRFIGLDYTDEATGKKLDAFIRWVQHILLSYDAYIIQLTIGDKGSFLYAAFGAPVAHDDTADRAVSAALQLHRPPPELEFITSAQIGLSQGRMRTGAYGASTHRTYGVLGNQVNIAARLMSRAEPGQILVSQRIVKAVAHPYSFEDLDPIWVKGIDTLLAVSSVLAKPCPTPQRPATIYTAPLVGREKELAYIDQILDNVLNGAGRVLCLQGPAGVGKSHLAAEVVEHALRRKFRVAVGMCQSITQTISLYPWRQIMPVLFELTTTSTGDMSTAAQQMAKVQSVITAMNQDWLPHLPLLRNLLDLDVLDPVENLTAQISPELRRNSLLTLIIEITLKFSAKSPLLLLIEDAQWLDELSRALTLRLGRSLTNKPILLLMAQRTPSSSIVKETPEGRSQPTSPLLTTETTVGGIEKGVWAIPEMAVETLTLADLLPSSVAALATNRLAGQISPLALDLIQFRAQGNPFFVEEVVDTLHELGCLSQDEFGAWDLSEAMIKILRKAFCLKKEGQHWTLDPQAPIATLDIGVPDTIHDTVLARIDHLPQTYRMTLKTASVIGRIFDFELLFQAHPDSPTKEMLLAEIEAMQDRDLIRLEQPLPHLTYMFKHNITQEVIYETLLNWQQDQLHQRVGEALERLWPEAIEQLAYHYSHTSLTTKTLFYVEQAAYKARQDFATETALTYFNQALALEERWEWLKGKVEMLHILGQRDEEKSYLERFELLSSDRINIQRCGLDYSVSKFTAAYLWGQYYEAISEYTAAEAAIEQALTVCRDTNDTLGEAQCLAHLGLIARRQGDYDIAKNHYNQSITCCREQAGEQSDIAWTLIESITGLGTVYRQQGEFEQAQIHYQQSLALSRQHVNKQAEADALNNLGVVTFYQRDFPKALNYHQQALRIRRIISDRAGEGASLTNLAQAARDSGNYHEALEYLNEALIIQQEVANRWEEVNIWIDLGGLYYELGELTTAQSCLERGLSLSQEIGDEAGQAFVLCNLGLIFSELGFFEAAETTLQDGLRLAEHQSDKDLASSFYSYLGMNSLQANQPQQALTEAQVALDIRRELEIPLRTVDDLATLAAAHLTMNQFTKALDYARQMLATLEECAGEGPEFPQRAYFIGYRVLLAAGQVEQAQPVLQAAYNLVISRADKINDPAQRHSFLEQRAMNQVVVETYKTCQVSKT